MRILLRFIVGLLGFVAFLSMGVFGALWAYGQYGAPLIEAQLRDSEDQIEAELEDEHPGSNITVEFKEVFYKVEGTSFFVAFEVNAIAEIGGIEVENSTTYASINIWSVVTGNAEYETYEESEWDAVKEQYKTAPKLVFDGEEAKKVAITWLIVSAAVFVGSIVINAVVLRKRKIA